MKMNRRPTLKDVAERSGFGLRTVKKVISSNEPVGEETRKAILKAATELNYQKNNIASALAKAKDTKIAVIYSETTKAYFPEVERGFTNFADECIDFGMSVEFLKCYDKSVASQEAMLNKVIADPSVSGVIIQPVSQTKLNPLIEAIVDSGRPVITFGADASTNKILSYIGPNAYKSGRIGSQILANYIGKQGEVYIISQIDEHMQTKERKHGFVDRVNEMYPDIQVFELSIPDNSNLYYEMVKTILLKQNVKGLFCTDANSYIAGEVLKDLGRKDIAVVGFDLSEMATGLMKEGYLKVMLEQNPEKISYQALKTMFNYLYLGEVPNRIQHSGISILTSECLAE